MPTLYDAYGRPVQTTMLTKEIATPQLAGVRQTDYLSVATGLTPEKLAETILAADSHDIVAQLTLAMEMEEREIHYSSVLATRKRAVTGLPATVEAVSDDDKDVEIADTLRDQVVDTDAFGTMLPTAMDAIGKGYSVTETIWDRSGEKWKPSRYVWRDQRYFQFDRETDEIRMRDESDITNGVELEPFKFIYHKPQIKMGLTIRNGLARLASVVYMLKGYTMKDWWSFMEVFGMPMRVGRYGADATEEQKQTLLNAVIGIGMDAACTIPKNMEIEFLEAMKSAGGQTLFLKSAEWLDKQISKGVLGQVASTEGTPGRLGNELAQDEVRDDITKDDARQLSMTLRRDLVKPFVDLNYGVQEKYPVLRIVVEEPEDLVALSKAMPPFINLGMRVEESWARDKFNAPEPEEGAVILKVGGKVGLMEPVEKTEEEEPTEEEEALEREHRAATVELMRKVQRGETLTADQRAMLVVGLAPRLMAAEQSTTVQTLILSKERFETRAEATKWIRENDYHAAKVDETKDSWRYRQRDPSDFKPKSFRTITITTGVKAVIGRLKNETAQAAQVQADEIDRLTDGAVSEWRRIMDPVLRPVLDLAQASASYQEFLDGLERVLTDTDSEEFQRILATATFTTRGLGDATDEL